MNISESVAAVTVLRVLQGLRKPGGAPYTPDEVLEAAQLLADKAGKALLGTVPVSRAFITQTLDHLAELDDDADLEEVHV